MIRLHAHLPTMITPDGLASPFVSPTPVNSWKAYLGSIIPEWPSQIRERNHVISNLAHFLQYLEFTAALMMEHYDRHASKRQSSLHSTVEAFVCHQFCMFSCSTLEGLGSYLFRYNRGHGVFPLPPRWNSTLCTPQWRDVLKKVVYPTPGNARNYLNEKIQKIIDLRHAIHLDTVTSEINYMKFGINSAFVPAHQTLREILIGLGDSKLPSSSVLLEVVSPIIYPSI